MFAFQVIRMFDTTADMNAAPGAPAIEVPAVITAPRPNVVFVPILMPPPANPTGPVDDNASVMFVGEYNNPTVRPIRRVESNVENAAGPSRAQGTILMPPPLVNNNGTIIEEIVPTGDEGSRVNSQITTGRPIEDNASDMFIKEVNHTSGHTRRVEDTASVIEVPVVNAGERNRPNIITSTRRLLPPLMNFNDRQRPSPPHIIFPSDNRRSTPSTALIEQQSGDVTTNEISSHPQVVPPQPGISAAQMPPGRALQTGFITRKLHCTVDQCRTVRPNLSFADQTALSEHLKYVHNIRQKPCPAPRCVFSFDSIPELKVHLRMHKKSYGSTKWRCPKCDIASVPYAAWLRHQHEFHETGLFVCRQVGCNFKTAVRNGISRHNMSAHRRTTTVRQQRAGYYRCTCDNDSCPAANYYEPTIERHIRRVHFQQPIYRTGTFTAAQRRFLNAAYPDPRDFIDYVEVDD